VTLWLEISTSFLPVEYYIIDIESPTSVNVYHVATVLHATTTSMLYQHESVAAPPPPLVMWALPDGVIKG
jgi:hypothetical protein